MIGAALTSLRGSGTLAQCNLMAHARIDLSGQNLEGLRMDEADLSGADLSSTVWVESRLREVSWVGARSRVRICAAPTWGNRPLPRPDNYVGPPSPPLRPGCSWAGWGSWWPSKSLQTLRAPPENSRKSTS